MPPLYTFEMEFIPETDTFLFTFTSGGGKILKAVEYSPVQGEVGGELVYYTLSFGNIHFIEKTNNENDKEDVQYEIDYMVEDNNSDVRRVFRTVISTLVAFFKQRPTAIVYIEGSTPQRMRIYRNWIALSQGEVERRYKVQGYVGGIIQNFLAGVPYEFILISCL